MPSLVCDQLTQVLQHISGNILTERIYDPGNLSNVISDDLTVVEKTALSLAAANALRAANWNQIIW